jgi:hypothetical protein
MAEDEAFFFTEGGTFKASLLIGERFGERSTCGLFIAEGRSKRAEGRRFITATWSFGPLNLS